MREFKAAVLVFLAITGCGVNIGNRARPEIVIGRYAAVVAKGKPNIPADLAGCVDVDCVATVGATLDDTAKGFRRLPKPPAKIQNLVQRTLVASDQDFKARSVLVSCSQDHASAGYFDVHDCPVQFAFLRGVVVAWAGSLRGWGPYLR